AEKGYRRLMEAIAKLNALQSAVPVSDSPLATELTDTLQAAFAEMDHDFNTPKALARLFELCTMINKLSDGQLDVQAAGQQVLDQLRSGVRTLVFDIFGLLDEAAASGDDHLDQLNGLMQLLIDIRAQARQSKDWATSDKIRDALLELEIELKDGKEGTTWTLGS